MESRSEFDRFLRYDTWANGEALVSLERAGSPTALDFAFAVPARAVRCFAHILGAELVWLARLERAVADTAVWPDWDLDESRRQMPVVESRWQAYARSLTPDTLAGQVSYRNSRGEEFANTAEAILTHVFMHSTYHRGQIASSLREAGHEPAMTDFIHAVRTGKA